MNMCQLVIGTALGSRFIGITRHLIIRTVWLGFLSVIIMQLIGLLISLILTLAHRSRSQLDGPGIEEMASARKLLSPQRF